MDVTDIVVDAPHANLRELRESLVHLTAINFVPRCTNKAGNRKWIEYKERFMDTYESLRDPPYLKQKILLTLCLLFIEPYTRWESQGSLQTHPLNSGNLRRDKWIQDLYGMAKVSRVTEEWRIVWSHDSKESIIIHAACTHQELYSKER